MMRIFLLLLTIAVLYSCKKEAEKDLSDFEAFYTKFHQDSLYQIEHITFPLEGLPANADSAALNNDNFRWQKEDWEMHKPFDSKNGEFEIQFTSFGEDLIIEKVMHKSGRYGMLRRFARISGEWHLIYYAGFNRVNAGVDS